MPCSQSHATPHIYYFLGPTNVFEIIIVMRSRNVNLFFNDLKKTVKVHVSVVQFYPRLAIILEYNHYPN